MPSIPCSSCASSSRRARRPARSCSTLALISFDHLRCSSMPRAMTSSFRRWSIIALCVSSSFARCVLNCLACSSCKALTRFAQSWSRWPSSLDALSAAFFSSASKARACFSSWASSFSASLALIWSRRLHRLWKSASAVSSTPRASVLACGDSFKNAASSSIVPASWAITGSELPSFFSDDVSCGRRGASGSGRRRPPLSPDATSLRSAYGAPYTPADGASWSRWPLPDSTDAGATFVTASEAASEAPDTASDTSSRALSPACVKRSAKWSTCSRASLSERPAMACACSYRCADSLSALSRSSPSCSCSLSCSSAVRFSTSSRVCWTCSFWRT